jgi:RNA polymerase sigma-70 factor (ECF subfamily)
MTPADKPTSLTLLERVRGRDEEAWRRLLHLYGPLVDRWSSRRGVRGEDLDDVRQEVFQAVAADLDRFRRDRPGDTFRGWLRVIAGHKILDHFRRRQKYAEAQGGTDAHVRIQQIADLEFPDDTEDDLGDLYLRALELVRGEFEPKTWTAFWLTAIDGQAPADVAAGLGVTAAAVRKAKSRVLLRLRQEVGDLFDQPGK